MKKITGSFYEEELLRRKQKTYRIEKVIRRDYEKKKTLVKRIGYSDTFNSWIPLRDL